MNRLNLNSLKDVNGGDFFSGICHISQQGYDTQTYGGGGGDLLALQQADKVLTIPGLINNGLSNQALGPVGYLMQPIPGC